MLSDFVGFWNKVSPLVYLAELQYIYMAFPYYIHLSSIIYLQFTYNYPQQVKVPLCILMISCNYSKLGVTYELMIFMFCCLGAVQVVF